MTAGSPIGSSSAVSSDIDELNQRISPSGHVALRASGVPHILVCFQRFSDVPGNSLQHERDIAGNFTQMEEAARIWLTTNRRGKILFNLIRGGTLCPGVFASAVEGKRKTDGTVPS
jgi:hypothetical protein